MEFKTCQKLAQLLGLRLNFIQESFVVSGDTPGDVKSFEFLEDAFYYLGDKANDSQVHFLTHKNDLEKNLLWDFRFFEPTEIGCGYTFWARKGVEIAPKIVEMFIAWEILGQKLEKLAEDYKISFENIDDLISFFDEAKHLTSK